MDLEMAGRLTDLIVEGQELCPNTERFKMANI
jgi:hypothetical protein